MRVLATILFVLFAVLCAGLAGTWAMFDWLHGEAAQVGMDGVAIAVAVLVAAVAMAALILALAVPIALMVALGATLFGLALAMLALVGAIGFALWPWLLLGAIVWWAVRRTRTQTAAGSAH